MNKFFAFISIVMLANISNAYAYLDPGTGSIIIQSLIAAVVGGMFAIKTYWFRIKEFFDSRNKKANSEQISKEND